MIAEVTTLVERDVSRFKLRRELEQWRANIQHRERGWVLLRCDEDALVVEIGFLSRVALSSGSDRMPVMVCAIRLEYDNYDLLPPSLSFIDAFTGAPSKPHVRAIQWAENAARDVLIDAHPDTLSPFLCVPGVREYHSHPQHTGDSWLLHRSLGEGSVSTICERVWRFMSRNVLGLHVQLQALPEFPLKAQLAIVLTQGDVAVQTQPSSGRVSAPDGNDLPT